jgi:small multidrug resistance family-3 protein
MPILQSVGFFVLAAAAELGGAYLVWQWVREGRPWWLALIGAGSLFIYALLQTSQSFGFGRAFAAYGGIFIAGALVWGWLIDGRAPDPWDWIGAAICLAGAAVILWMPRA